MKEKPNVRQTKFRFKKKKKREEENRNAIMFRFFKVNRTYFFITFIIHLFWFLVFLFQVFKDATQPETYIEIDFGIY